MKSVTFLAINKEEHLAASVTIKVNASVIGHLSCGVSNPWPFLTYSLLEGLQKAEFVILEALGNDVHTSTACKTFAEYVLATYIPERA